MLQPGSCGLSARSKDWPSSMSRLEGALANNPDGSTPTRVNIPALPSDVHDISTLAGISRLLAPGS